MSLEQVKADSLQVARATLELYEVVNTSIHYYTRKGIDKWLSNHIQVALNIKYGTTVDDFSHKTYGNASVYIEKSEYSITLRVQAPRMDIKTKELLEYGRPSLRWHESLIGREADINILKSEIARDLEYHKQHIAEIEAWDIAQAKRDITAYKEAEKVYNNIPYQLRIYGGL